MAYQRPSAGVLFFRWFITLLGLGLVVVLLVAGFRLLVSLFSGDSEPEVAPTVVETTPFAPVACDVSQIAFSITPSAEAYSFLPGSEASASFSVQLTHAGGADCTFESGNQNLVVAVFSGKDRVWDSATCELAHSRPLVLLAASSDTQSLTWDFRRSGADCSDRPFVASGTYRATILVAGQELASSKFTVTQLIPEPEVTDETSPDSDADADAPIDGTPAPESNPDTP